MGGSFRMPVARSAVKECPPSAGRRGAQHTRCGAAVAVMSVAIPSAPAGRVSSMASGMLPRLGAVMRLVGGSDLGGTVSDAAPAALAWGCEDIATEGLVT